MQLSGVKSTLFALLTVAALAQSQLAVAQECEAIPVAEFNKRLDAARNRIYLVKYDDVKTRLEALVGNLPCLTEVLPREALSRVYLYRGVVAFNQGDEAGASAAFRQAVAVDRGSRWDERFGQRPREIFIEAKEAALLAPKGSLRIPELQDGVVVYLDGEPVAAGMDSSTPPGEHFLQLKTAEGTLQGWLLNIPSGESVVPPIPAAHVKRSVAKTTPRTGGENTAGESGNGSKTGDGGEPNVRNGNKRPPEEPKEPPKPFEISSLRPVSYGLLGVGGLGLVAGLGGGVMYWQTFAELNKTGDDGNPLYYSDRSDANKDALLQKNGNAALLADIGFAAAVLFGGGGVGMYFLTEPKDPATLSFVPVPMPGGGSFVLSGRF